MITTAGKLDVSSSKGRSSKFSQPDTASSGTTTLPSVNKSKKRETQAWAGMKPSGDSSPMGNPADCTGKSANWLNILRGKANRRSR